MSTALRKIDADGLRVGMYVSRLDRPWLETPFLFQGFCIRNDSEIADLRRYCDYVEIDIEESDSQIIDRMPPVVRAGRLAGEATLHRGLKQSTWQRIRNLFVGSPEIPQCEPSPGEYYKDTATTAEELAVADDIHLTALDKLGHVLDQIRNGASVSLRWNRLFGRWCSGVISEWTGSHSRRLGLAGC
jgi:hypothetical protein